MRYRKIMERLLASGFMKESEARNPLTVCMRLASVPFVMFCVRFAVHPNIVTSASLALGCSAAAFYLWGEVGLFIVSWTMSVILDYADGTVARKSGKESYFGYLLDMFGDRVKLIALIVAWASAANEAVAYGMAGVCIAILLAAEAISHMLVRTVQAGKPGAGTFELSLSMPYQVFVKFDMHSFFLYGLALLYGGLMGYAATGWLMVILTVHLVESMAGRVEIEHGKLVFQRNDALIGRALRGWRKSQ